MEGEERMREPIHDDSGSYLGEVDGKCCFLLRSETLVGQFGTKRTVNGTFDIQI